MSWRSNGAERVARAPGSAVRALRWLRRSVDESLLRNALYILGTTAVTSVLGFGFWLLAARLLPAASVGRAAALVSTMLLVAAVTNLGIGQVLVSRLGSRDDGRAWSLTVTTGLLAATLTSLAGGVLAAGIAPALVPELKGGLGVGALALLPVGVAAVAYSIVVDFACIAERQAKPSFLRNAAAALIRLALIGGAAIGSFDDVAYLLAVWVASFLLIDAHGTLRTIPSLRRGFRPTLAGWRHELGEIRRLIAGHQSINLGSQAFAFLLPVIVLARSGPADNAYFYATFMLASGLFFIAPAISNSLFAEGAHRPHRLSEDVGRAIRYLLILAVPVAGVLLVAGPTLLGFFGADYADEGTGLLYVLIASTPLDAAYQLELAVLRARARFRVAAAAAWAQLIVGGVAAWVLLGSLGLIGAGLGWAAGKACGVLVALLLTARRGRTETAPATGRLDV